MNFLGSATSLDSFLKAYKTRGTKSFFPYDWFECSEKVNNKELPPYDSFFSILRNNNPLGKDYNDFQNFVNSGLTTEQAVVKLRMDRVLRMVLKINHICKASGRITTCSFSQNSSSGKTINMFFRHWGQCRKRLNFTTTRELIC